MTKLQRTLCLRLRNRNVSDSAHCNMKAGEYAYHADPYTPGRRRTAGKAPEALHGKQPFRASCGGRVGGAFGKVQVRCCCAFLSRKPDEPNKPHMPELLCRTGMAQAHLLTL